MSNPNRQSSFFINLQVANPSKDAFIKASHTEVLFVIVLVHIFHSNLSLFLLNAVQLELPEPMLDVNRQFSGYTYY